MRYILILLLVFLPGILLASNTHTIIDNKPYIELKHALNRYKLNLRQEGNNLIAENKTYIFKSKVGSSVCTMNSLKFFLLDPIKTKYNKAYISEKSVYKIIEPVIYPNLIDSYSKFDTVVIDPGHGGRDAGAVNDLGTEAGYNLDVAKSLSRYLRQLGYKVIMTRTDDTYIPLASRAKLANKFKHSIFISIHFNASSNKKANGIETFILSPQGTAHYGKKLKQSDWVERLGNKVDCANIALATGVHGYMLHNNKREDRGIKYARFSVLSNLHKPGILIEGGFMSNSEEKVVINDIQYREQLAKNIALGINRFNTALKK